MKSWLPTLAGLLLALTPAAQAQDSPTDAASDSPLDNVRWIKGPSVGPLGDVAEIQVPKDFLFAGPDDTRVLMEAMRNPTSGTELGFYAPTNLDWFVVFEFDEVGYVPDDEKASLDAEAMLESIKRGTAAGNEERRSRGWPTISILGWQTPPRYDDTSHNLEWAVRASSEMNVIVNHNTRILGRGGVMRVTLVSDPESLPTVLPLFRDSIAGFSFKDGHRYAEYRPGDKIAKYGLTALVVGGATAVAVKSGAFKWLWKILVVGVIAFGGVIRRLFSRNKPDSTEA